MNFVSRHETRISLFLTLVLAISIFSFTGCSDKGGASNKSKKALSHIYENLGPYQGWEKKRFENIVFIYPPDHPEKDNLEDLAKVFSALSRRVSTFLSIAPPDSVTIYFYPNAKHGITVTGFFAPFADENGVIHFWLPSRIGQPVAKLVLERWSKVKPKYKFLKEGVAVLFDGTGENYHRRTLQLINSNGYIPLSELAKDTTVNADRDRTQSALAASFVDYIVYTYGIVFFRELYEARGDFDSEVEQIFKIPEDSLEQNWLKFVRQVVEAMPDSSKK